LNNKTSTGSADAEGTPFTGRPLRRREDERLVRGAGSYTADRQAEGAAWLVVVRALAVGRIASIDTAEAKALPGVLAVLTGEDAAADRLGSFAPHLRPPRPDGGELIVPPFPPLAAGSARYVGDPLALVVAETLAQAEDAAEAVLVDIDSGIAVTAPDAAVAAGAATVWPDVPGNVAFLVRQGDREAVDRAFADAAHVVEQRLLISRVTAAPMEPRSAIASFDPASGRYTIVTGTQTPHRLGEALAPVLQVEPSAIRVISPDCGGCFGMKNTPFPEYAMAAWAAKRLGRDVRWTSSRVEAFLADSQAREQVSDAALALDADGHFLALRVKTLANLGAYLGPMTPHPAIGNLGGLAGVYRTPAIFAEVQGIHTHTQNVSPYRGAGRPEATYVIERLVDLAAAKLGLDRAELRRRNLIRSEEMPFKTGLTFTYDCGDFPKVLEQALEAADWAGFPARREASRAKGRLRGIGIANPVEIAAGPPNKPFPESAGLELRPDGGVTARVGSGDSGQGHATSFAQILADRLGLEPERITIETGDSELLKEGIGTFGSRSMAAGGTALDIAVGRAADALKAEAADALEVAVEDLRFERGRFTIEGTDRALGIMEVVARRQDPVELELFEAADNATFPNGCHVCELEIDPETGAHQVVSYLVVDDVGTVINPLLVAGQIHGGVAQGLGQALGEQILYEAGSGQLLTASFMDYTMPRAADLPMVHVQTCPVPTAVNPLGVKGAGEAGTVGALAAGISAVVDALSPLGIRHFDMPASPERVWQAICDASRSDQA
jgi:carbon-monoxide dehydrogenase large subunit